MKAFSIILLWGLTVWSCQQTAILPEERAFQERDFEADVVNIKVFNEIEDLLEEALLVEKLQLTKEFNTNSSFLFFESGNVIDRNEKHAVAIYCPTDSTYVLMLYSLRDSNKWHITDSLSGLESFPTQFERVFDDYNFDGQTDIYIQISASNGWSLSRGHLIIIDPITKKLGLHRETREFANMKPDKTTQTVRSELWNGYNKDGQHQLTVFTHKWAAGVLTPTSKREIIVE